MTYCLGIRVEDGLLMLADTRTNAGIDNVSSFKKLHCLADEPDRQIFVATCGSLSVSQSAISELVEDMRPGADGDGGLLAAKSLFRAAELVGQVLRRGNEALAAALGKERSRDGATMLLGGRIGDEPPRLFLIYREGNFIECKGDVPFLQIGETKYGRPILDRVLSRTTPLAAAVKIAFLSFDSAMRSNLSVARPLDLMVMSAANPGQILLRRIEHDDAYFNDLSGRWSSTLIHAAEMMPEPSFLTQVNGRPPLSLVSDLGA